MSGKCWKLLVYVCRLIRLVKFIIFDLLPLSIQTMRNIEEYCRRESDII